LLTVQNNFGALPYCRKWWIWIFPFEKCCKTCVCLLSWIHLTAYSGRGFYQMPSQRILESLPARGPQKTEDLAIGTLKIAASDHEIVKKQFPKCSVVVSSGNLLPENQLFRNFVIKLNTICHLNTFVNHQTK